MSKIYINDYGHAFLVRTHTDISGASVLKIKVKKPDLTTDEWVATLDGTEDMSYTVASGDLDQSGTWEGQAYVEDSGWVGHGETFKFKVRALFD